MHSSSDMGYGKWNMAVLAIVFALAAAAAAVNYRLNFYGVFGNVAGKKYVVYDNERSTKYLFSYNYLPSNFEGLLLGSSISDNWDTGLLTVARTYNASIDGGNISEEALVAGNFLQRNHPKIVLLLIYPYLTETYGRKSGYMNPQEYWGALGSIQLLRAYGRKWLIGHGYARPEFNEFGRDDFYLRRLAPAWEQRPEIFVDARAFQEYVNLLQQARASGARIVGIIPPVALESWKLNHTVFTNYYSKITPLFHADEPIIDLNQDGNALNAGPRNGNFSGETHEPEMERLRADPENFPDGVHLSLEAAQRVVKVIDRRLARMERFWSPAPL